MGGTELILIIIAAALTAAAVVVGVCRCCITAVKKHKTLAVFIINAMLFSAIVLLSAGLCVYYRLPAVETCGCILLGAAGALSLIALLMMFDLIPTEQQHKVSWLTAAVVLIVLLLQIAVGVLYPRSFDNGAAMSGGELFGRVVSSTFQYFSLDANYQTIIRIGAECFRGGTKYIYYVLSCSMTAIAPIAGGFAIFGVLGHFFPRIVLWRNMQPTKYVFSELNEYSIETAESIFSTKKTLATEKNARDNYIRRYGRESYNEIMRSVIIFTDVYADKTSENYAELIQRAADINAICLKDDILTRKIYWTAGALLAATHTKKKVVYFLMDKSDFYAEQGEENNLRTAVSLFATQKAKSVWAKSHWWQTGMKADAVEIYVFSRSENADETIKNARMSCLKQYYPAKVKADKNAAAPAPANKKDEDVARKGAPTLLFKVLNEYQNLVLGLLNGYEDGASVEATSNADGGKAENADANKAPVRAYPLYSRYGRELDRAEAIPKLSVLILGGGRIATTFLKSVYWCGQMLNGDKPTELRIAVISKDVDRTQSKLKFELPQIFDDKLSKYKDNPECYCRLAFKEAEYGTEDFLKRFQDVASGKIWAEDEKKFVPSSVSPDVDYILVALGADNLNMQAADYIRRELCMYSEKSENQIPVNYVIENNALCDALEHDVHYAACVLNPFGSLKERFSFVNICMTDMERRAMIANAEYDKKNSPPVESGKKSSRAERKAARKKEAERKEKFLLDAYSRNSSVATALHAPYKRRCIDFSYETAEQREAAERRVLYLEHRRWCAYTRSTGMRTPTPYEFATHCVVTDEHGKPTALTRDSVKNTKLKLHACLVECGDTLTDNKKIAEFLKKHGNFRADFFAAVEAVKNGKVLEYGGKIKKQKVEDMHGLFEYLRKEKGYDMDDLDLLSAALRVSDESADSYKNNDIAITNVLRYDGLCGAVAGGVANVLHVGVKADELRNIVATAKQLLAMSDKEKKQIPLRVAEVGEYDVLVYDCKKFAPLGAAYKAPATAVTVNADPEKYEPIVISGKSKRKGFAIYDEDCAIMCVPYGKKFAYKVDDKCRKVRVLGGAPTVK